ncbi:MAG: Rdx family protein [Planctomycetota bacterium]
MPTAASLAAAIEEAHPGTEVESIPGKTGQFLVTADGNPLWDKQSHPERRFPKHDEVLSQLSS